MNSEPEKEVECGHLLKGGSYEFEGIFTRINDEKGCVAAIPQTLNRQAAQTTLDVIKRAYEEGYNDGKYSERTQKPHPAKSVKT